MRNVISVDTTVLGTASLLALALTTDATGAPAPPTAPTASTARP